jgi:hypothetical protein
MTWIRLCCNLLRSTEVSHLVRSFDLETFETLISTNSLCFNAEEMCILLLFINFASESSRLRCMDEKPLLHFSFPKNYTTEVWAGIEDAQI